VRNRLALLLALGGLGIAQVAALYVWPPQAAVRGRYDAIVVLSGDHGDRFGRAQVLASRGVAPVLVVLRPDDGPSSVTRPLCHQQQPYRVECVDPAVVSTAGDAATIDALAKVRRWRRVVVVTSRFHVVRSRLVLHRCAGVGATVAGSDPPFGVREWAQVVAHELAGTVQALTVLRCPTGADTSSV
jgi:uncharacterized SAM-binding protein YcdF (DUF218 family)